MYPFITRNALLLDFLESMEILGQKETQNYNNIIISCLGDKDALYTLLTRYTPENEILLPNSPITLKAKAKVTLRLNAFVKVRAQTNKTLADTSHRREKAATLTASRVYRHNQYERTQEIKAIIPKGDRITITLAELIINAHKMKRLEITDAVYYAASKHNTEKTDRYFWLYEYRKRLKQEDNPAEAGIKIAINSIPGVLGSPDRKWFIKVIGSAVPLLGRLMNYLIREKCGELGLEWIYTDTDGFYIKGTREQIGQLTKYSENVLHDPLTIDGVIDEMYIYAKKRYVKLNSQDWVDQKPEKRKRVEVTGFNAAYKAIRKMEYIVKSSVVMGWDKETTRKKCEQEVEPEDFIKQINFKKMRYPKGTEQAKVLEMMGWKTPAYNNFWLYRYKDRAALYKQELEITEEEYRQDLDDLFQKLYQKYKATPPKEGMTGFGKILPDGRVEEYKLHNSEIQAVILDTWCLDTLRVRYMIDEKRTSQLIKKTPGNLDLMKNGKPNKHKKTVSGEICTITRELNNLYKIQRKTGPQTIYNNHKPNKMFKQVRGSPSRRYNAATGRYCDIKQGGKRSLTTAPVDVIVNTYIRKIQTEKKKIIKGFGADIDFQMNRIYWAQKGDATKVAMNADTLDQPLCEILRFYKETIQHHIKETISAIKQASGIKIVSKGSKITRIDVNLTPHPQLDALSQEAISTAAILENPKNRKSENAAIFTEIKTSIPVKNISAALYKKRVDRKDIESERGRYSKHTIMKKDHKLLHTLTRLPEKTRYELKSFSPPCLYQIIFAGVKHQENILQFVKNKMLEKLDQLKKEIQACSQEEEACATPYRTLIKECPAQETPDTGAGTCQALLTGHIHSTKYS